MMNQNERMIETQARIISELRRDYSGIQRELQSAKNEINRLRDAGEFYLEMQEAIKDNPILQSEWVRFCSFLKMSIPDHQN